MPCLHVTIMQPSFQQCWNAAEVLSSLIRSFLSCFMSSVLWSQTKKHGGGKMLVSMCLYLIRDFPLTFSLFLSFRKLQITCTFLSELYFHCSFSILTNLNLFLPSKYAEDTSKYVANTVPRKYPMQSCFSS